MACRTRTLRHFRHPAQLWSDGLVHWRDGGLPGHAV